MSNRSQNIGKFVNVDANTLDNIIDSIGIQEEKINWIILMQKEQNWKYEKGSGILSKSKDIALLIEIHNIDEGKNFYTEIIQLLNNDNFKIEFEMIYEHGERHIIKKTINIIQ